MFESLIALAVVYLAFGGAFGYAGYVADRSGVCGATEGDWKDWTWHLLYWTLFVVAWPPLLAYGWVKNRST